MQVLNMSRHQNHPGHGTGHAAPLRLTTEAALDTGLNGLARVDPAGSAAMTALAGRPALRANRSGFEGLAATIVAQQVSTASAAAIFARFAVALIPLTPETVLRAEVDLLRGCGLSAAKIRTLRTVAQAIADGALPLDRLADLPVDDAHARLVALKGIGPWTADVFLLFCLGHPDAFPAGDLALQEAARLVFGGDARPSARDLTAMAERWRPFRGVAAYLLWGCYRALRGARATPVPTAS
ncbi:DNA-3-methyladenine glycosylase family protein [Lichenifustis flavocetrariae]|uniref:DNA-3-methyladenine glycosylase II n=1 Tax=Lichenifustis flavocetrariae TaxID=2949735 RepID=A0AA41YWN4_9HYPH|nr:DNA-3-methyladenine glycosylase [Lichenifustis flavocetrariae]MCW6509951.1 DNA-3-methyladenine glycosylase [Lichenifustis flavocetrariae]